MEESLEQFGKVFIEEVRDLTIDEYLMIKSGEMKSSRAQTKHQLLSKFDPSQLESLDEIVFDIIDRTVHNILRMFEYNNQFTISEKMSTNGENDLVEMSDGLSGELYTEDGWIAMYSMHTDKGEF